MVKLENYIKQIYSSSVATPMGNPNLETFDTQTQNEITEGFNEVDRQLEEEAQEVKNNTVIGTGSDGNEITLGGYVDAVMENLNTMEVPKLRKTIIEGIISEDEKYRQQTLPKIEKYIKSIMGDNFIQANIDMMSLKDRDNMVIQVAQNLNMTTGNKQDDQKVYQQISKIFQSLIGE